MIVSAEKGKDYVYEKKEVHEDKKDSTDAKEKEEEKEAPPPPPPIEEQGFYDYGFLAVSIGYRLTNDNDRIIYKIMNNTGRSIDSVYGWVYRIEKDENSEFGRKVLVNNPNSSGMLISKSPQKPSTLGTWAFALKKKSSSQNAQYMLNVNQRSVFYAPFEFPESRPKAILEKNIQSDK